MNRFFTLLFYISYSKKNKSTKSFVAHYLIYLRGRRQKVVIGETRLAVYLIFVTTDRIPGNLKNLT